MSFLQALNRAYDSIDGLPGLGQIPQKVSYVLRIGDNGLPTCDLEDIRLHKGTKSFPVEMYVPRPAGVTVTSGIYEDFAWGKAVYVLGITETVKRTPDMSDEKFEAKKSHKLEDGRKKFDAFRRKNLELIEGAKSPALLAFKNFLEVWTPEMAAERGFSADIGSETIVVSYEANGIATPIFQTSEAQAIWANCCAPVDSGFGQCLLTGDVGPTVRLHPKIKGVVGTQAHGASFTSCNNTAFSSYEWEQGANASVSVAAAFRYGAALQYMLQFGSGHSLTVGDTSIVFWAEAPENATSKDAVDLFGLLIHPFDQRESSNRVATVLSKLRDGASLSDVDPSLADGVRFHILGLSGNSARIVTRFYLTDNFGKMIENISLFRRQMTINGFSPNRSLSDYLVETAPLRDKQRILPRLGSQWLSAVLDGTEFPATLIPAIMTRIKVDGDVNLQRAQIIKAHMMRSFKQEVPMALDPDYDAKGYLLGRLFSVYEQIQRAANPSIRATIRERFFAAATTSPRRVFPSIAKGSQAHLAKIKGKQGEGLRIYFQRAIEDVVGKLDPKSDPFPLRLSPEDQAAFMLGYYHQNSFRKAVEDKSVDSSETTAEQTDSQE